MCYEPARQGKSVSLRLVFPTVRAAEAAAAKLWGRAVDVQLGGAQLVVSRHMGDEAPDSGLTTAMAHVLLVEDVKALLGPRCKYNLV
jgi:hypothetical protein